ncbi:MAG TPA: AmmeMemoRadiSam system protein A [Candidatus Acidoferrales bacterium]
MSSLAESEKNALLQLARQSFVAAVNRVDGTFLFNNLSKDAASIMRLGGAFVTLMRHGRLRGCIGQLPSGTKLVEVVTHCAYAVASEDSRFPRVLPDDLASIEIELSVLSEVFDIKREEIESGKHGLFVSNRSRRGVLLPQVALQFHWDGTRFLEAACEKAGLARDAWKDTSTRVQAFTAEVFSETEFRAT